MSPPRSLPFFSQVLRLFALGAALASARAATPAPPPAQVASAPLGTVVVTTSLLATAVHDLVGDTLAVETLMPAGTCPGQYDLDPGQARRIRTAGLVLRHERQGFMDERCIAAGVSPAAIVHPASPGLWTVPTVYAQYCDLIGRELAQRWPALESVIAARRDGRQHTVAQWSARLRHAAAPLRGTRVLAAQFQAEFLSWLELEVVGTFPPTDDPPPALVRDAIRRARAQQAVLVVGNLQSGERLPQTLASALGLPCAMLSNFPTSAAAGALGTLLEDNVQRLHAAARTPTTNAAHAAPAPPSRP